jgi:hypothetical protein
LSVFFVRPPSSFVRLPFPCFLLLLPCSLFHLSSLIVLRLRA